MTCPVRRDKNGIPYGCWQLVKAVVLVTLAVLALLWVMG